MIGDNFSIFTTNCAVLTSYIRADPRTFRWLSRGCCPWMNMICSHSQVERVSFCVCSRNESEKLWKKTVYSGIKLIREFPKQCLTITKTYFWQFVIAPFVCIRASWQKFLSIAHLHSAARALSSPSRCFQLSTNFDKDFFRCLLCWDAATISSNA